MPLKVPVNQCGLKLNDMQQLLVFSDELKIPVGNIHAIKKNTEALVTSKISSEVDAD
jgi:hypothetical protein